MALPRFGGFRLWERQAGCLTSWMSLIFDGREVAEFGVSALPVVEDLQVLEDLVC